MAIITLPTGYRIASIDWRANEPDQVNRSPWTGRSSVFDLATGHTWACSFEAVPMVGQENFMGWRAFLAKLRGRKNSFRLIAVEKAQRTGANPTTILAAGQGAVLVSVGGLPASQTVLGEGALITFTFPSGNEQMCVLHFPLISGADGTALMQIEPPLREALPLGSTVETKLPTCLMRNADPQIGWSVSPGQQYSVAMNVEEAW